VAAAMGLGLLWVTCSSSMRHAATMQRKVITFCWLKAIKDWSW